MTRVLLICPEPLGHGQPAGIGIRFLEMARVLRADGHAVTILSPDSGLSDETLRSGNATHDVAIVQGHVANAWFAAGETIPTVVDLYDPYIIENLHYFRERGAEVFNHDHATLMLSLQRGDLFLCASEAQRLFYLGALLAAGRVDPVAFEESPRLDSLVRIAPFGVHPPRSVTSRNFEEPSILFGGIYDWYDPILAIDAIAIARQSVPGVTLTFNTHPNPDLTPQGKLGEAVNHVRRNGYESFVRFEPWVAYERRAEFFDRFAFALLTFPPSIETDLSMRTRVYDYLWCGLPIVTSSAAGTDEILEHYGAGSVLRSDAPEAFAEEIVAIVRDGARYERMVAGSQRFVVEHQWPRALEPLREFCRAPRSGATTTRTTATAGSGRSPRSLLSRIRGRLAK